MLLSNIVFLAASVTWTAPPPAWTQTDRNDIRTVNVTVINGSTQVPLRWNYTLSSDSVLFRTTFSIDYGSTSDDIGAIFHGSGFSHVIVYDYRKRFNISKSEIATLIINKVTEKEEAVYQCELGTLSNTWRYRIRVNVTGNTFYLLYIWNFSPRARALIG